MLIQAVPQFCLRSVYRSQIPRAQAMDFVVPDQHSLQYIRLKVAGTSMCLLLYVSLSRVTCSHVPK